jgi:hypothetical protein
VQLRRTPRETVELPHEDSLIAPLTDRTHEPIERRTNHLFLRPGQVLIDVDVGVRVELPSAVCGLSDELVVLEGDAHAV